MHPTQTHPAHLLAPTSPNERAIHELVRYAREHAADVMGLPPYERGRQLVRGFRRSRGEA